MIIFIDIAYTDWVRHRDIISIGLVAENGRSFYAEFNDVLDYKLSDEGKQYYDSLEKLNLEGDNFVGLLEDNTPTKNIKDSYKFMLFKTNKSTIKTYLEVWFKSFGENIEIWSFITPYQWELFCDVMGGNGLNLPKYISKIPFDLATLAKLKGIDPLSIDLEGITGLKYGDKVRTIDMAIRYSLLYSVLLSEEDVV